MCIWIFVSLWICHSLQALDNYLFDIYLIMSLARQVYCTMCVMISATFTTFVTLSMLSVRDSSCFLVYLQ